MRRYRNPKVDYDALVASGNWPSGTPTWRRPGRTDEDVIQAFTDKLPAESKKLTSTGARLDGNWMGGTGIASWSNGKIHLHDLGSKASLAVAKKVAARTPRNWIAEDSTWILPKARRNPAAVEFRGDPTGIAVYIDRSLMTTEYFPSYEAAEKAAFAHLRALHFSKEEAAREARSATRSTIHSGTVGKLDRNPRPPTRGGRFANPRKRNPATLTPHAIKVAEAVQLESDVARARSALTMFRSRDAGYAEARMLARIMIGGIAEEMAAEWQKGKRLSGPWLTKKLAQKKYQRITMLDLFEAWATLTAARMDALQGTR